MREIEEEAYKRIPLEILKSVADFCKKNEITYSLHYGTLLGAVRHKGYIPWDDDIDIVMPRKDYEKFRRIYKSAEYPLIDLLTDKHYPICVAKIYDANTIYYFNTIKRKIGLFIDVFVLDNMPDDIVERKEWLRNIKRYQNINAWRNSRYKDYLNSSFSWKFKLLVLMVKLIPVSSSYIHKKIECLIRKYEPTECKYVGCPIDIRSNNFTYAFEKDDFNSFEELDFEGYKFTATANYDKVLKILYGNYMQLPPEDQRVGKHGLKAYYR